MKTKRAKSTDIPMSVKKKVFERDHGECVVCGNKYNVMPNAHILSRAHGGLGIETNVVTLCTRFTINDCHYKFDNGTKNEREYILNKITNYMKSKYDGWSIDNQRYSKY
jgi:5-methylcytosine-specific restriction endonuclease McrA